MSIKFASATSGMMYSKTGIPYAVTEKSYVEYRNKELRVRLGAKKGLYLKPSSKRLKI